MTKNVVLCFDGTSNQFGVNNTNVIRLVQVLNREAQRLYYDPGIGTLPEPQFVTRVGKRVAMAADLAFASSLTRKVQDAYRFLMNFWEPGSKVFLFGFSRGAYTARVLAGMLHILGLLSRGNETLVPYVMKLYRSIRGGDGEESNRDYWRLCNGFRQTFARATDKDARHFKVHFVGLWDTVSSAGWLWDPLSFPFTAYNPSVTIARHAVAIDERRAFFRQNLLATGRTSDDQNWEERWFPGVHADVGGGYSEKDSGLWLVALDWMLREAQQAGLLVNEEKVEKVRSRVTATPWMEAAHESLTAKWLIAEYYPKRSRTRKGNLAYRLNRCRQRFIPEGARIDRAALRRIKEGQYMPSNLSEAFIRQVKALVDVPDYLPFQQSR